MKSTGVIRNIVVGAVGTIDKIIKEDVDYYIEIESLDGDSITTFLKSEDEAIKLSIWLMEKYKSNILEEK